MTCDATVVIDDPALFDDHQFAAACESTELGGDTERCDRAATMAALIHVSRYDPDSCGDKVVLLCDACLAGLRADLEEWLRRPGFGVCGVCDRPLNQLSDIIIRTTPL